MTGSRTGLIVAAVFICVFVASYAFLQIRGHLGSATLSADIESAAPQPQPAPPPAPVAPPPAPAALAPEELAAIEPPAGVPAGESPMVPGVNRAIDLTPPGSEVTGGGMPPPLPPKTYVVPPPRPGIARDDVPLPPAAHDPAPAAMPPAAHDPEPAPVTPVVRTTPPKRNGNSGSKVLSYFQHTRTQVDTSKAFGFVLLPRVAVTSDERDVQKQFCEIMLATMDFMTPGAVSAAAARSEILATYWPIAPQHEPFTIKAAFVARDCGLLITWYDHKIARSLAAKAGVAHMTGPLLITWPSSGAEGEEARNPLIVDFSKADHERATKALQYWFRQLRAKPELWTNRIREGTIRAELADAVNDTAGVVLAVLHGKWDSLSAVATP